MVKAGGSTSGIWRGTAEGGFIFMEVLIALPLLVMLLMGIMTLFFWCMHCYFINLADEELVQEVQGAFTQIMEDALRGESIEQTGHKEQSFAIISKADPLGKHTSKEEKRPDGKFVITYGLHTMAGTKKLIRGDQLEAPLTGDHALACVTIEELWAEADGSCPGIYKLHIMGRSEVTQHAYTLESAVYLPGP